MRQSSSPNLAVIILCGIISLTQFDSCTKKSEDARMKDLDLRLTRLVQVPMEFDASGLSAQKKEFLRTLVEASKLLHAAYLHQYYPAGVALRDSLAKHNDEHSRKLLRLVVRNGGPFDKMDHFKNLYDDVSKPPGGGYYPSDLTKEEFESYLAAHPDEAEQLKSPSTVVRREGTRLKAIPFHVEFSQWTNPISELLTKASGLTDNPSLKKYLASRAQAFLTDDYYQSDVDWIDLKDNDVDVIIGPYEVYDDGLMGLKASYEATVGIKDQGESAKLEIYTKHLDELEKNLPHDTKYKRSIKGLSSPMVIVTDIIRAGDIATGYQPVAANLPNDPRVIEKKGAKRTFWRNMLDARLKKIILPVGQALIDPTQVPHITPEGYFNGVLMHELCHALGPQYVYGLKPRMRLNEALKELYSPIEEGKADMAGLHSIRYFIEKGVIPKELEKDHYVSDLASIFRTIRFGTTEAHGRVALCELNYLRDRGGFRLDPTTKKWSVDFERIGPAISDLAKDLLTIESTGDYQGAAQFFEQWGKVTPEVAEALKSVEHVPVDVEPVYSIKWE
jgi:hypothetical protein